ncbi:MAG: hypothetical protein Q8M94_12475 [Ignavibacteria bacterium]|nr:hypothetical protein [Ignavibacteria bacterium]
MTKEEKDELKAKIFALNEGRSILSKFDNGVSHCVMSVIGIINAFPEESFSPANIDREIEWHASTYSNTAEEPVWLDKPTNDTGWWWFRKEGLEHAEPIYVNAHWYAEGYILEIYIWTYLDTEKGKRGKDYYYKAQWDAECYTEKYKGKWLKVTPPESEDGNNGKRNLLDGKTIITRDKHPLTQK